MNRRDFTKLAFSISLPIPKLDLFSSNKTLVSDLYEKWVDKIGKDPIIVDETTKEKYHLILHNVFFRLREPLKNRFGANYKVVIGNERKNIEVTIGIDERYSSGKITQILDMVADKFEADAYIL